MRRCLQCGAENLELARFCSNCGNPLLTVRPQLAQHQAASFSPEFPGPVVQEPPRQSLPESAWPTVQEAYYPPARAQPVARSQDPSPHVPGKAFSAPQSAAPFPTHPPVSLNRNRPEFYPQRPAPVYAPSLTYGVPPLSVSVPKKKRQTLLFALLGIAVVLILAVAGLFFLLLANRQPQLNVIQGQPIPGQQILLQGDHFPNGSKISLVVDTGLLIFSQRTEVFLMQSAFVPVSSTETNGVVYRAVVGSDGTFTIKIRIPTTWKSGSQHTIVAEVVGTKAQQVKPVQYQMTIA